jgi:eukaryotic-like serine/threonine-protein kinase
VTDFGIARALATIRPDEKYDVVWGSPQYFSPEQASGGAPSPSSDVYSLGVILYEMLAGELPFTSSDASELARMHREVRPIPLRRINPQVPPELEQIILKILSKEPSSRYRSADQLGRILLSFSQQATPFAANIPPVNPGAATTPAPVRQASAPLPTTPRPQPAPARSRPVRQDRSAEIDWMTILLGLLAVIAVGGLIPFWLYIWFSLTSNGVIP